MAWAPVLLLAPLFAQPRAIVADGDGPWRDAGWNAGAAEFRALLTDAGYSVTTVSPVDVAAALHDPAILVAVPSLERLPIDAFRSIATHVDGGGGLMASGGEPFREPLYRTAAGEWVNAAAYQQATGAPPPQGAFLAPAIPTVSPSKEQYTAASDARVPITRNRGLFSNSYAAGRYRVIGDLLAPVATLFVNNGWSSRPVIVWLPAPKLVDPYRSQLVEALRVAPRRLYFSTAGADQMVWLPGEIVTGAATVANGVGTPADARLEWAVTGPSGVVSRNQSALPVAANDITSAPLLIGNLPAGDYTIALRLTVGEQETDRLDSPFRVLDPAASRQPEQRIRVVNGSLSVGGQHILLNGVNYWPRSIVGTAPGAFNGRSWLEPEHYDPDIVEADLKQIAGLGFRLVNIQFSDYLGMWATEGRSLIDFLERCRTHGLWAQIALRTTLLNSAYAGGMSPDLESYIQAAALPGNDRVFAYELLWEPMVGMQASGGQGRIVDGMLTYNRGRQVLDGDWRQWVDEQYGSVSQAEETWGVAAPSDPNGQMTNPLDEQMQNDGPWRVMVAAYRRFLDDYLGRNLGAIARRIRRLDPDALITYRNWLTMTSASNDAAGYDIGTGAAHLDFVSPEWYSAAVWPENRAAGLIVAYGRYRTGGKPVRWGEFGADVGPNGGTAASRAAQGAICDSMMRSVAEDGSDGASVWWWPGGPAPLDSTDFGIIDPSGAPRECATVLAAWNRTFATQGPGMIPATRSIVMVDRDEDARGSYGLFLKYQDRYVRDREAGRPVSLLDSGAGSDTASMALVQVGNVPYRGTGPLKYVNGEIGGIRVVCPGMAVTVENGATVAAPAGSTCDVTPTVVNTGEARWLPTSAAAGGVVLETSAGDLPVEAPVASLDRTTLRAVRIPAAARGSVWSGRLKVVGVGVFGERLTLRVVPKAESQPWPGRDAVMPIGKRE